MKAKPKTARGRIVWFFLKNLPGFLFVLFLIGVSMFLMHDIEEKKAMQEEELKAATAGETPPINVVTLNLRPTRLRDRINLPGLVEPWTQLELMAKVGGSIEEVSVQEGDYVKKGQQIAKIETRDYRIDLDSARAAYALAQAEYTRNKILRKKGIATQADLDQLQAQLRTAKAALEEAELRFSRCVITAPMNGIISKLDAEVGMYLNQMMPEPIAEIIEIDRVKAVIAIPESDITAVRKLKKVAVTFQALGNETIMAPVHFLAPAPESIAHAYRLELALDNKDRRILPGMFIRADVVKVVNEQAVAVPLYAVISRNNEHFVYIEKDGKAGKRTVETGFLEGWQVLISKGLKAGEKVIIEGHRTVADGQEVKVVKVVTDLGDLLNKAVF